MLEKDWQKQVVAIARRCGWAVYHTYDSRRSAPGYPDLTLVRERLVFAELKREDGKLSSAQEEWLERLRDAGVEVHVWRPSDLRHVHAVLAKRDARVAKGRSGGHDE